jgi:hypothetical protein
MRRPTRSPRLATLCVHGDTAASTRDNSDRILLLEELVRALKEHHAWHPLDAILLPGGFFWLSKALGAADFERRSAAICQERFASVVPSLLTQLQTLSPGVKLVTGVMARPRNKKERIEQACIALDHRGLIGVARKIFPTHAESRGRRFMSPIADDYRSVQRFVELPNGSIAALHSCYDLFGTADIGTGTGTRRSAIRTLRSSRGRLTENDEDFHSNRDSGIAAWTDLMATKKPDVLMTSIHAFERPGLDGYWQRHGIARASAAFAGAMSLGAAHFLECLPTEGSTLAAYGVPKRELTAGVSRRAHSLAAIKTLPISTERTAALLRLFMPPSSKRGSQNGGRA